MPQSHYSRSPKCEAFCDKEATSFYPFDKDTLWVHPTMYVTVPQSCIWCGHDLECEQKFCSECGNRTINLNEKAKSLGTGAASAKSAAAVPPPTGEGSDDLMTSDSEEFEAELDAARGTLNITLEQQQQRQWRHAELDAARWRRLSQQQQQWHQQQQQQQWRHRSHRRVPTRSRAASTGRVPHRVQHTNLTKARGESL